MVSDNGDRVGCPLNILMPFCESKDHCEQFPVIDVIVSFGGKEDAREVGAGVKVTIGIALYEDSTGRE